MKRELQAAIYHLGVPGSYQHLVAAFDALEPQAQRDLIRLLRAAENRIADERRSMRLFPGGPRIRG